MREWDDFLAFEVIHLVRISEREERIIKEFAFGVDYVRTSITRCQGALCLRNIVHLKGVINVFQCGTAICKITMSFQLQDPPVITGKPDIFLSLKTC